MLSDPQLCKVTGPGLQGLVCISRDDFGLLTAPLLPSLLLVAWVLWVLVANCKGWGAVCCPGRTDFIVRMWGAASGGS